MESWRSNLEAQIAEVSKEIQVVEQELSRLRDRRKKLQKELYDGRTGEVRGGDSLIVLTSDLRPIIKGWIETYDRQFGKGGQAMLADKSKVSTRLIRAIANGEVNYGGVPKKFVTLQTADRLLQAMGLPHRIHDLDIYSNNRESRNLPKRPPSQYFEE